MNKLKQTIAILGLALCCAGPALAQDFPAKPVRIVVPYSAGGPVDALLRAMAPLLVKAQEEKQGAFTFYFTANEQAE